MYKSMKERERNKTVIETQSLCFGKLTAPRVALTKETEIFLALCKWAKTI